MKQSPNKMYKAKKLIKKMPDTPPTKNLLPPKLKVFFDKIEKHIQEKNG